MKSKIFHFWPLMLVLLCSCKEKSVTVNNNSAAWYKNQLIYNLDIKTFKDSDGDGTGDLAGLVSKLGYLDSLGVTTIWLAPFQPSPWQDDGYDVSDYYKVDPRLGTMGELKKFLAAAKEKHMKVIMDLILNHTSITHPWFHENKDWYLWSSVRPSDWDKGMGFPKVEKETWRLDSTRKAYYFHRFYHFEPDLNYQNPAVVAEAKKIMGFWLNAGLDGFRLDAVPFIIDDPRKSAENPAHDFKLLNELTAFVVKTKPGALLLGEANVKPEEAKNYFAGNLKGLDMMLNFDVNEYLFYAMASGDADPLKKALKATSQKPGGDQWGYFLRNHDEIDLKKLSKRQIALVYEKMGPDTNMQLYDRGIRRRLAPMLGNNQKRLFQAYSLLFALPGTPIMRYGEEIGMGDDLRLKERLAVRTPMQWDGTAQGGFSVSKTTIQPVLTDEVYGYKKINVQQETQDTTSLYAFIKRIAALRKAHPEIGQGSWRLLSNDDDGVLIILYTSERKQLLICYNFKAQPVILKHKLPVATKAVELITKRRLPLNELGPYEGRWYSTGTK